MLDELVKLAEGMNKRFPKGNQAYQITTRLLEECGEVAKEVNRFENSGTKMLRHGQGSKEDLASEIKDTMNALMQLALFYDAVDEVEKMILKSITQLTDEGYIESEEKGHE